MFCASKFLCTVYVFVGIYWHVERRGQLVGLGSLLLPYMFWRWNSGPKTLWQVFSPTESSYCPLFLLFNIHYPMSPLTPVLSVRIDEENYPLWFDVTLTAWTWRYPQNYTISLFCFNHEWPKMIFWLTVICEFYEYRIYIKIRYSLVCSKHDSSAVYVDNTHCWQL